uniref:Uncharacterized protein n=1 Tax=Setaria viridis TaxID=4556 RepID=A0A4V6D197_SETVI|nr:hypothetical protein SEVIR_9G253801v2 [Setaria viridis]
MLALFRGQAGTRWTHIVSFFLPSPALSVPLVRCSSSQHRRALASHRAFLAALLHPCRASPLPCRSNLPWPRLSHGCWAPHSQSYTSSGGHAYHSKRHVPAEKRPRTYRNHRQTFRPYETIYARVPLYTKQYSVGANKCDVEACHDFEIMDIFVEESNSASWIFILLRLPLVRLERVANCSRHLTWTDEKSKRSVK